jgi:hypothetical protein
MTAYEGFHKDTPSQEVVALYITSFEGALSDADESDNLFDKQHLEDDTQEGD